MGPYHTESTCPCCYVLVLLPSCAGRPDLVETIYHDATNSAIRPGSGICLFRFIHLLLEHLLSPLAHVRQMRRRRIRSLCRDGNSFLLSASVYLVLFRHVQEGSCQGRQGKKEGQKSQPDSNKSND